MIFTTRAELRRILRESKDLKARNRELEADNAELRRVQRENRELKARVGALEAELREERSKTERITLALLDRVLTASGCYALPKEVTEPKQAEAKKPAPPEQSPVVEAYLEAVRQEGVKLGKSQAEIDSMVNRIRRGERVIPEVEEEFTLPN